jgi:hypothetical protein
LISLPVLLILALAAYRGTQLVVHDTIADPIRNRLYAWHANKPDSRPRKWATKLISCPYCAGFWVSGITLTVYLTVTGTFDRAPLLIHGIEWFALAGAQALLNRRDDTWDNE